MRYARWAAALYVGFVVTLTAGTVQAQSFGIDLRNTMTPASGGMAGTSIARPQDVASALNANPAALTQYKGTHFLIGGGFAEGTMNLNQTGPAPLLGVSPFSAKSGTPGAAIPSIAVSQELSAYGMPVTLGLGLVGAAGAGTSFIKQPESNGTSTYLLMLEFAASAAVKMTDQLSLGATMFVGDGYMDGPFVGTNAMTNAYALRGSVGADFEVNDENTIGLYYMSKQTFRFKDETVLFDQTVSRDVRMSLPDQVGIGLANTSLMDGRLLLAADVLYLNWKNASLFRDIYRDQWVLQLGTQYKLTTRTKLRLGYAFAENPLDSSTGTTVAGIPVPGGVPAVKYLQAQLAVINQHRFSAGVGVSDVLPGVDFDAFAGGMFRASQQLGDFTNVNIESYFLGLGFTWHFDRGSCCLN